MHHVDLGVLPRMRLAGAPDRVGPGERRWVGLPFWSLHTYDYEAVLRVDGRRYDLRPGSVTLVPPGAELRYRWPQRGRHVFVHADLQPGATPVPEFCEQAPVGLAEDCEPLPGWQQVRSERAAARLLDVLWRLADSIAAPIDADEHLLALIDARLAAAPSVVDLAAALGCSRNTLTRRVRRRYGCTVQELLRRRRAAHARRLLEAGFRPGEAAAQIGLHDAQAFNKLLRKVYGESPRSLRRAAGW